MGNQSNEFQKLIHLVYRQLRDRATVTESKRLRHLVTGRGREVDVVIEVEDSGMCLIVSVECIDWNEPADVTWVEKMHTKHLHLPTNKLVLVSRSGFTPDAVQLAGLYGHDLLTLEEAIHVDWTAALRALAEVYFGEVTLTPTAWNMELESSPGDQGQVELGEDEPIYDKDGLVLGTFSQVAMDMLSGNHVASHLLEMMEPETERTFGCSVAPGDPMYVVDQAGVRRAIKQFVVEGIAKAQNRIPVKLRHHAFRGAHVAYGPVEHPSGRGIVTFVEQQGKTATVEIALPGTQVGKDRIMSFERVGDPSAQQAGDPPEHLGGTQSSVTIQGFLARVPRIKQD